MNLLYLSLSYVPSRRASSVQVMRMCEAFAAEGHRVTLVAKRHAEPAAEGLDPHAFYGVAPSFGLELVARPPRRGGGVVYAAGVLREVLRQRRAVELVYSRDLLGAAAAAELGLPVAFESHGVIDRGWQRALWRRMISRPSFRGLVAISNALRDELGAADLLPRDRPVVVAHSPAQRLEGAAPRAEVSATPRIGYVGSLYPGRGVELVVKLAARMPGCAFELIGGSDDDLARWRATAIPPNVRFHGFVPPARLPALYRALDVLLMPYPLAGIHGATRRLDTAKYCSPMKMFEYMASGVPMVASSLPVLQEVLAHERNALIAPSDDEHAWVQAISRLAGDPALRVALAGQALRDLDAFTPRARAARIARGLGLGPA